MHASIKLSYVYHQLPWHTKQEQLIPLDPDEVAMIGGHKLTRRFGGCRKWCCASVWIYLGLGRARGVSEGG